MKKENASDEKDVFSKRHKKKKGKKKRNKKEKRGLGRNASFDPTAMSKDILGNRNVKCRIRTYVKKG